jgi:hypothetical protein
LAVDNVFDEIFSSTTVARAAILEPMLQENILELAPPIPMEIQQHEDVLVQGETKLLVDTAAVKMPSILEPVLREIMAPPLQQ